MNTFLPRVAILGTLTLVPACNTEEGLALGPPEGSPEMRKKVDQYATFRLTTDLGSLSAAEREMIPLLIEAARHMDAVFWHQACGDRDELLRGIDDSAARRFAEINYGPWDRLDDNAPFIEGVGPKPAGAGFYPADATKEEIEDHGAAHPGGENDLRGPYTMVRRTSEGGLHAIPYHEFFAEQVQAASKLLEQAADMAEEPGLKRYLELRSEALLTDEYRASDMAWLDMKGNTLDVVIGPIETYEDKMFGAKAANEAYVLVKDKAWSARLAKYAELLPDLQRGLPVPEPYKAETPGRDSDLNAYDVIYYAGDCNAGSKTIAINLPNDEEVQLAKGTRRLQLKNAMRAKFDRILVPIAGVLIDETQRDHITFDAFFGNTMFHEVAHGLGIKNTVNGKGTVREALAEHASALEEGKADILGLYMVGQLFESGDLDAGTLTDNYVTFLAGIFRSIRFGASSAHGRANMIRFNFFERMGAFERDSESGTYRVNEERMGEAVVALSNKILSLQGDGDYEGTLDLIEQMGSVGPRLQADLDRLADAGIPVDIIFDQGLSALGL